jgi:primosomal replication protein N
MELDGGRIRRWKAPPDLDQVMHSARDEVIAQADDLAAMNHAVLTGRIAADPLRDVSRKGDPVTVLLIAFDAPDEKAGETACCEAEVPDEIAETHRKNMRAGAAVLVSGALTGAGGLWVTMISVSEASK